MIAPPARSPVELIAEARRALRQVERLLLDPKPRDIEFCRSALAEANSRAEQLRDLLSQTDGHTAGLADSVTRLRAQAAALAMRLGSSAA